LATLLLFPFSLSCDDAGKHERKGDPMTEPPPSPDSAAPQAAQSAPAQPTLSKAVTDVVGRATADVLLRGKERETFRVDAKKFDRDVGGPERFFGYPILRRGRALTDAETRKLATLLRTEGSYSPHEKYKCDNEESYGVRIKHGSEVVELLFLFPCNRIAFLKRASGDPQLTPGEYFDPVGDAVLEMLRAAVGSR
jgi:hypothetical protein